MPKKRGLPGEERYWQLMYSLVARRRTARRLLGPAGPGGGSTPRCTRCGWSASCSGLGPKPVSIEKLKPGQFLSVEAIDPRTFTSAERKLHKR